MTDHQYHNPGKSNRLLRTALPVLRWSVLLAFTGLAASGAAACGSDFSSCEENNTCGNTGGTSGTDGGTGGSGGQGGSGASGGDGGGCDPLKSPAEEACLLNDTDSIYVSPSGDDVSGDGSRLKPLKSLKAAVKKANQQYVVVCGQGKYTESLRVENGMVRGIIGGFDCVDWSHDGANDRPQVEPAQAGVAALTVVNGDNFRLEHMSIRAAAGDGTHKNSVGLFIWQSADAVIRQVDIEARGGEAGAAGPTVAVFLSAAKGGVNASGDNGGVVGASHCGTTCSDVRQGGNGGNKGVPGNPGVPKGAENGGTASGDCNTQAGGLGVKGDNGQSASKPSTPPPNSGTGKVTKDEGWKGLDGANGGSGKVGQGGGGGAGAKASSSGGGGSGGCGGCPGKGGGGGKAGGGSVAIVVGNSGNITIENAELKTAKGGDGGKGGDGQKGQDGGLGGKTSATGFGCSGGNGGNGGHGAGGNGGNGGVSAGIVHFGTQVTKTGGSVTVGEGGKAGAGGGGNASGNAGKDGAKGEVVEVK